MPFEVKGGAIAPSEVSCATCKCADRCRFDRQHLGGFKGKGPRYIGFRLICDSTAAHAATKTTMRCFDFVETVQARMNFGKAQRDDGKDGEFIRVIAQEGDEIELRAHVGFNSLGEIVRPQREIVEALKAAGHKIGSDHSKIESWDDVVYKTTVPRFADEQKKLRGYADKLMREEMEAENATDDAEEVAWRQAQKRLEAKPAEPQYGEAKRGPGRPPKESHEQT